MYLQEQVEESDLPKTALTRSQLETYSQQRLPSFQQFLELAKKRGKIAIFDLREPPVGHVYHKKYINQTLGTIAASGIQHDKVRMRNEEEEEEKEGEEKAKSEREREGGREGGRERERERERERCERMELIGTIWQRNYTVCRGFLIKFLIGFPSNQRKGTSPTK